MGPVKLDPSGLQAQRYAAAHELRRCRELAVAAAAGLEEWRARLRTVTYSLYRHLAADDRLRRLVIVEARAIGGDSALLLDRAIASFADLIDEGRAEPSAPPTLTRATAELLAGAMFNELYLLTARRQPLPPERQLVPKFVYLAVLPYLGEEEAAAEVVCGHGGGGYRAG